MRGGFADVAASGLTLLAEQATPLEQFDTAQLAQEIKNAEEDLADARTDEAKNLAAEKLDQLNELKTRARDLSVRPDFRDSNASSAALCRKGPFSVVRLRFQARSRSSAIR